MSDSTPQDNDTLAERVAQVADEFSAELERGDAPRVEDYAERYPALAQQLLEVLPALKLMRAVNEAASSAGGRLKHAAIAPGERLGEYRIICEIGRGGMGVVYEAEQLSLGRHVALKVLPTIAALDARHLQRFKNEAHAAAQLHHTNIVPVYGLGCEDDLHFYAMQIIEGQTLADLIHSRRRAGDPEMESTTPSLAANKIPDPAGFSDFRQAAEWGIQASEALEHAHQVGILHRDIKPANLLIDREGQLWVTDFGLARLAGYSDLTLTGDLLGTIRYTSPEQALSKHALVDQRADIYSLGVTLYELLTSEPAFGESDRVALLHQVAFEEPRAPRRLNAAIPTELETIVLKSIAKSRNERYQSARELADDLRRFLDNRPIFARRPTPWQRVKKWSQRHRAIVSTAALTSAAALVAITILATLDRMQIKREQTETQNALATATARGLETKKARDDLQRTLADTFTSSGLIAADRGEAAQAVLWFAQAAETAATLLVSEEEGRKIDGGEGDLQVKEDEGRVRANRQRFRFWSRRVPIPVMGSGFGNDIRTFRFQPGGDRLLGVGQEGRCRILDIRDNKTIELGTVAKPVSAGDWSPDGKSYVLGRPNGDVEIYPSSGGEPSQRFHLDCPIRSIAFSADGNLIAAGETKIRIWDVRQSRFLTSEIIHPKAVVDLQFNDRGDRLATSCLDGLVRVYALEPQGDQLRVSQPFPGLTNSGQSGTMSLLVKPIFVDHDKGLVVRGRYSAIYYDVATGKPIQTLAIGEVDDMKRCPDGTHFVICKSYHPQLWATDPLRQVGPDMLHDDRVHAEFSPDGQTLLTASGQKIRRWSVPGGVELEPMLLKQHHVVRHLAYSSSGQFFAAAQIDGMARIYRCAKSSADETRVLYYGRSYVRLGPDGRTALPSGAGNSIGNLRRTQAFDVQTGKPLGEYLDVQGTIADAALAPDGETAVTVAATTEFEGDRYLQQVPNRAAGIVQRWNWHTGEPIGDPMQLPSDPRNVCFSPDGRRLVVLCGGGQGFLIDASNGSLVKEFSHCKTVDPNHLESDVQFAPDGKIFVTCGFVRDVKLWDSATGEMLFAPLEHRGPCRSARFSADGRHLVTASHSGDAGIWDVSTGKLVAPMLQHARELWGASFSPDGRQVLTACADRTARIWDWQQGKLAGPAMQHNASVESAVFSPDGRSVFAADLSGKARLYETVTFKPLTPWLSTEAGYWSARNASFSSDGHHAFAPTSGPSNPIFDFHELADVDALEDKHLLKVAELISGFRLEGSEPAGLTTEQWRQLWIFLAAHPPRDPLFESEPSAEWHRAQALAYENARNYAGAAWHLTRLIANCPEDPQLRFRLGLVQRRRQKWPEAIEQFSAGIRIKPSAELYDERALVHVGAKQFDKAIADYTEAIRLRPRYTSLYFDRGSANLAAGNYSRAVADFQDVLRLDPSFHSRGSLWLNLGEACERSGDRAQAHRWLEKAKEWFEKADKLAGTQRLTGSERDAFQAQLEKLENLIQQKKRQSP
jgi:eukaryotic-like serine/threonine-protein kinase